MPSQDTTAKDEAPNDEQLLFEAIAGKDLDKVKQLVKERPKINLNCTDKDELTPLQHACHLGDVELAKFLIDHGAGVDYTRRKDSYTPLMFAAISSKDNVVRLLLERGCDITIENCVNRTAAQMAAFVGQSKIVAIINGWIPYETSVMPFTKCRELEDKPRLPSEALGRLLHRFITYPSIHPVKLILFIKENPDIIKYADEVVYVLENLLAKSLKPPINDECLAVKYHYLSYLIAYCSKSYKEKLSTREGSKDSSFDLECCDKSIESTIRRFVKRDQLVTQNSKGCTPQVDHFIISCILKFPYPQFNIYKMMTCSFNHQLPENNNLDGFEVLSRTLNSPFRSMFQPPEACLICGEHDKNKKCSKCKSVYYCSSACQLADWFQHKRICNKQE